MSLVTKIPFTKYKVLQFRLKNVNETELLLELKTNFCVNRHGCLYAGLELLRLIFDNFSHKLADIRRRLNFVLIAFSDSVMTEIRYDSI